MYGGVWASVYLLHVVHALLQQLELSLVGVRVLVVGAIGLALLLPQELHLVPVGVQLPAQRVVLFPQGRLRLTAHTWAGHGTGQHVKRKITVDLSPA